MRRMEHYASITLAVGLAASQALAGEKARLIASVVLSALIAGAMAVERSGRVNVSMAYFQASSNLLRAQTGRCQ